MTPLSRVEKEHIFSIFYKERPNLYLISEGKKRCFSASHYADEDGYIKIAEDVSQFINCKKIFAFFFHRRVKIYFPVVLRKSHYFYFKIPDVIYIKEKKRHSSSLPILQLFYQDFLLSTFLGVDAKYSKKKTCIFTNNEIREMLNLSENMGHDLPTLLKEIKKRIPYEVNLYSHINIINDFLLKKKRGKLKRNNLYVFSDSNIILLFSTAGFAKQFNNEKKLLAKISFSNRNILCGVQCDFFSPFLKDKSSFLHGFLLLKITNIQEEDKRYLYEGVYSSQYGSI